MYQLTTNSSVIRLSDGACIPFDNANSDYIKYLDWLSQNNTPLPAPTPTRSQWEEAAIRRAAKLLAPNRLAVDSMLNIRPSVEHPALRTFRSEIIRISTLPQHAKGQVLVNLSSSTNESTAFALLNSAYNTAVQNFYAAITAINPLPSYLAAVKLDFDLIIDQMKAAL